MKCWVCTRQSRGFVALDARYCIGDARRYVLDWVFCSRRCQSSFTAAYGRWEQDQRWGEETPMLDATQIESAAMRQCLKFFGEAAAEIGFDKPLGAYSEAQALQVIEAIVTGYTEAMLVHHEQSKYPPVRGIAEPARDPFNLKFAAPAPALASGFEDLPDDLPWESVPPVGGAHA